MLLAGPLSRFSLVFAPREDAHAVDGQERGSAARQPPPPLAVNVTSSGFAFSSGADAGAEPASAFVDLNAAAACAP